MFNSKRNEVMKYKVIIKSGDEVTEVAKGYNSKEEAFIFLCGFVKAREMYNKEEEYTLDHCLFATGDPMEFWTYRRDEELQVVDYDGNLSVVG